MFSIIFTIKSNKVKLKLILMISDWLILQKWMVLCYLNPGGSNFYPVNETENVMEVGLSIWINM